MFHEMRQLAHAGFNALGEFLHPDRVPGIDALLAEAQKRKHVHVFRSDIGWNYFRDAKCYQVFCECGEYRIYDIAMNEVVRYSEE